MRVHGSTPSQLSGQPVLMHSWERPFRRAAQFSDRPRSCFAQHRAGLVLLRILRAGCSRSATFPDQQRSRICWNSRKSGGAAGRSFLGAFFPEGSRSFKASASPLRSPSPRPPFPLEPSTHPTPLVHHCSFSSAQYYRVLACPCVLATPWTPWIKGIHDRAEQLVGD